MAARHFLNAQAKSQANQLIQSIEQIAAAWRMYAINKGGNFYLANSDWGVGTSLDLVPQYLSELPSFSWLEAAFKYPSLALLDGTGFYGNSTRSNLIVVNYVPLKVCQQINLILRNSTAVSFGIPYSDPALLPYLCFNHSSYYKFYYRVF